MEIKTKECKKCGKVIASIYPTQLSWNYDMHFKSCKAKGDKQALAEKNLSAIAKNGKILNNQEKAKKILEEIGL